ncbi:hypothetical protein [Nocardia sp. NPDC050793]|uniref:hypothetical protein n=1 Tax=Nocardia sp. NPDC050793 TaxID=3155159 RepID=UPI003405C38E
MKSTRLCGFRVFREGGAPTTPYASFKGAPAQEVAAELHGLPFSTYRRHLATAVQRISDLLWHRELNGH